jgi:F-type H+-transporting ATPase subunit gamma
MAGIREIRRRIRVVKSIEQITKAMKMVAAAKLRKAQDRVIAARPYADKMHEVIGFLAGSSASLDHPLVREPAEKTKALIFTICGNRGLCGSYNTNIFRETMHLSGRLRDRGMESSLIVMGKRGVPFFRRRGYGIADAPPLPEDAASMAAVRRLSRSIQDSFASGETGEAWLVYTKFVSVVSHRVTTMRLLPLERPETPDFRPQTKDKTESPVGSRQPALSPVEGSAVAVDYLFEPDAATLLGRFLPRVVDTMLYQAIVESMASEHGARMTSMTSATDKAGEMIQDLTLFYNKARQASITKELLEIVSGAEALA